MSKMLKAVEETFRFEVGDTCLVCAVAPLGPVAGTELYRLLLRIDLCSVPWHDVPLWDFFHHLKSVVFDVPSSASPQILTLVGPKTSD